MKPGIIVELAGMIIKEDTKTGELYIDTDREIIAISFKDLVTIRDELSFYIKYRETIKDSKTYKFVTNEEEELK